MRTSPGDRTHDAARGTRVRLTLLLLVGALLVLAPRVDPTGALLTGTTTVTTVVSTQETFPDAGTLPGAPTPSGAQAPGDEPQPDDRSAGEDPLPGQEAVPAPPEG